MRHIPASLTRGFGYITLGPSPRLRQVRLEHSKSAPMTWRPLPLPPLPDSAYGPDAVPLDCSGIPPYFLREDEAP